MLRVYNSLTRKIEDFKPIKPPVVGYYSCGPTVYDFAHIGHARTYIFADVLQRVLEFNGYKVKRVMNITDVGHLTSDSDEGEDKMENGAKREGKTVWEIAKFYTDDFFLMLDKLNIKRPEIICKATDHITSMIQIIEVLEKKGFTYKIADGIYFDTSKFPDYGELTGQTFEKLQKTLKAGARVEMVEGKKSPTDFALWKFTPVGVKRQMEWDSPYGRGFPGWHIECSAMSMKYLGETFDIHTGGVDHIPIHHSNEIAQSEAAYRTVHGEAATGKPFVKYWLHADHLLVEGEKMSKSLGNYYRVKDLEEKGFSPLALRYLFLTANYRTQLNFTWESMKAAQSAHDSLRIQIAEIKSQSRERTSLSEEKLEKVNVFREKFTEAIDDDLNTAQGLSVVWEVIKSNIPSEDKYDLILLFDEVLGLGFREIEAKTEIEAIPKEIKELIDKREEYRKQGLFKEADKLRQEINDKGYTMQDTPGGSIVISNMTIKKLIDN